MRTDIDLIENERDVLVFIVACSKVDGETITDAQRDAMLYATKSVAQMIGVDCSAACTSFTVPNGGVKFRTEAGFIEGENGDDNGLESE